MGRENAKNLRYNSGDSVFRYFLGQYCRMGSLYTRGMEFQLHDQLRELHCEDDRRK